MEGIEEVVQTAPSGGPSGDDGFNDFAGAPPAVENGSVTAPLDDFFSGSSPAPAAAANEPISLGDAPAAAPEALFVGDGGSGEASGLPDDGDAFFQSYVPTPKTAPEPEPEVVDPRVDWRKLNAETLKKKDAEEAAADAQIKETAAKHLAKFYEVRTTTLTTRKANNRKSEAHQKEVEVPANGTAWEKVNALVNFNTSHHKDISRYKALLITCKAKNVAIRAA